MDDFTALELGEYNEDTYYFLSLGSRSNSGFLAHISLCDKFVSFKPDGTPIERGQIKHNSCCLRCDAHASNFQEKKETWRSLKCVDLDLTKIALETMKEYLDRQTRYQTTLPEDTKHSLDICPHCYDVLEQTGQQVSEENTDLIAANML